MEKKVLDSIIQEKVGEYGIVRSVEQLYWSSGKTCGRKQIWYDVCLEHGSGDIVASFNKIVDARKWAKEN